MPKPTKAFAFPVLLAALSLSATSAAAAELPTVRGDAPVQVSHSVSNYGGGWGGRHRYRHRGRTTAGDVLGAVLVLGTIAAVANAASKANRERSYPYPDRYPRPYADRRGEYRPDARPDGPQGLEGAADLCLREVERDARARDVTRVERNASGWLVTGEMADGAGFTCSIGADGRIERIEMGGRAQVLGEAEPRYNDEDTYRSAEARVETDGDAQPAYPGGPLPGEVVEDAPEYDPET